MAGVTGHPAADRVTRIYNHYTRNLLICQDDLAVFTNCEGKIVTLYRFFALNAGDFGNMRIKNTVLEDRKLGFVAKSCFLTDTFFEKGLAFSESLWYNSTVTITPTRGTAG